MSAAEVMARVGTRVRTLGEQITDAEARVIATEWHGGPLSALYSLATCGAVRDDLANEIAREQSYQDRTAPELYALRQYVLANGVRPPVSGWANLTLS